MKCPYCAEEVLSDAKKCKHCREWLKPREFRWGFWVMLILAALIVGGTIIAFTMSELNHVARVRPSL